MAGKARHRVGSDRQRTLSAASRAAHGSPATIRRACRPVSRPLGTSSRNAGARLRTSQLRFQDQPVRRKCDRASPPAWRAAPGGGTYCRDTSTATRIREDRAASADSIVQASGNGWSRAAPVPEVGMKWSVTPAQSKPSSSTSCQAASVSSQLPGGMKTPTRRPVIASGHTRSRQPAFRSRHRHVVDEFAVDPLKDLGKRNAR